MVLPEFQAGFANWLSNQFIKGENQEKIFKGEWLFVMRRGLLKCFYLMLLLLLPVAPAGGTAFAGTGFSDVADSHWAAKHISRMSSMGIVGGYTDGTFRPNQPVKQVEAVLMAVRCMGGNADTSEVDVPFTVKPWAEQDMARAVALGLLKSDEAFYADSPASRAWVTRMLVRVVGKDSEARSEQVLPGFTDAYKIPDWATSYVKVAQKYNLVGGYSDNTFRPDRAVTRAELAVLLGRAMDFTGDAVNGWVSEAGSEQVVIKADNGKTYTFSTSDAVPVYDENQRITIGDLDKYDRVSLVVDGDTVKYVEKPGGEAISGIVTGIVQSVYSEMGALVVETPGGDYRTLYLPEGANISVPGSAQQGLDVLQAGDEVEITLDSVGYISGITVKSRSQEGSNEGIVYDLDVNVSLITLQGEDGKLYPYRLGDQVSVVKEGYRFPVLEDVHAGDRVRLEVEAGAVREIEVLEVSSRLEVNGTVIIVSPEERVITLETEGQLKALRVSAGAGIVVSGLEGADLDDIVAGDEVKVRIDNGEIVELEVQGRQVENNVTGTVVGVDTRNSVLTLKDSKGNLKAYEVKDNARILVDGDEDSLIAIEKDMKVEARLVDDELVFVEVDNSL